MADECSQLTYESEHVHKVYEQIAAHFSATRYKPWPVVEKFLSELPPGLVGLDAGCGNGKYLSVNRDVFVIGSDRSSSLIRIARKSHGEQDCIVADSSTLPHANARFDFVLSIAVIHHYSTRERRINAIRELLRVLKSSKSRTMSKEPDDLATVLIFVWALEQKTSRRGWDVDNDQDVLVPWVSKSITPSSLANGSESDPKRSQANGSTFYRYYHLYREGELDQDICSAGGKVLKSGYEKDNWYAFATVNEEV